MTIGVRANKQKPLVAIRRVDVSLEMTELKEEDMPLI
jgi:hypothetical protein